MGPVVHGNRGLVIGGYTAPWVACGFTPALGDSTPVPIETRTLEDKVASVEALAENQGLNGTMTQKGGGPPVGSPYCSADAKGLGPVAALGLAMSGRGGFDYRKIGPLLLLSLNAPRPNRKLLAPGRPGQGQERAARPRSFQGPFLSEEKERDNYLTLLRGGGIDCPGFEAQKTGFRSNFFAPGEPHPKKRAWAL